MNKIIIDYSKSNTATSLLDDILKELSIELVIVNKNDSNSSREFDGVALIILTDGESIKTIAIPEQSVLDDVDLLAVLEANITKYFRVYTSAEKEALRLGNEQHRVWGKTHDAVDSNIITDIQFEQITGEKYISHRIE